MLWLVGEEDGSIRIRPLTALDWESFRALRLEALQTAPGMFFSNYAAEVDRTEDEWRSRAQGDDHQVFGLYDGDRLVGMTGVVRYREDPTGTTAFFGMTYIAPAYRGRGLSRMLYEARLEWVRERPQFTRVHVSHRSSNEASRRANQHHGFALTAREPRTWPDGTEDDELIYELLLSPS